MIEEEPSLQHEANRNSKFRFFVLGMQVGAAIMMFVMCIVVLYISDDPETGTLLKLSVGYYPIFRALFLAAFFFMLYGIDLLIWRRFRVDYRSILRVSADHGHQHVLRTSTGFMVVMFVTFVLHIFSLTKQLPTRARVWPLVAVIASVVYVLSPINVDAFNGRAQRYSMIKLVGAVLVAPFSEMNFARGFAADVLTSMPKVLSDVEYMSCFYLSGEAFRLQWNETRMKYELKEDEVVVQRYCSEKNDVYYGFKIVLSGYPFWIRLMQCGRAYYDSRDKKHIFNALKYTWTLSLIFLSLSPWKDAWIVVGVIATVYGAGWDFLQDWGLGPRWIRRRLHGERFGNAPRWFGLRSVCLYPRWTYYFAIVTNTLTKFGWAVVISPGQHIVKQHLVLLLGVIELFRRTQWAVFRMEWEDIYRSFHRSPPTPTRGHTVVFLEGATELSAENLDRALDLDEEDKGLDRAITC